MSITASFVQIGGVVIPAYQAATGALVRALENVVSIVAGDTDDNGKQYAIQMAFSVPATDVSANVIVVIPPRLLPFTVANNSIISFEIGSSRFIQII